MSQQSRPEHRDGDLRKLSDPEFFAHWAATRNRLVQNPHGEIKREYDAVAAEYRRRVDGGLCADRR
jgi:hypothetical protein